MPPASDFPSASFALAIGLGMITLFLGLRQWYERRAREIDLSPEDITHFRHQDIRRRLGVGVMSAIALLVLAGSLVSVRAQDKVKLVFVLLWLAILALLVFLLILALADLTATRSYARRHRRRILRESLDAIRRRTRDTGASDPRNQDNGSATPSS